MQRCKWSSFSQATVWLLPGERGQLVNILWVESLHALSYV